MKSPRIGIIYKHKHKPARIEAGKLVKWTQDRGIESISEEIKVQEAIYSCQEEKSRIPNTVKFLVVLGGDGTLLGAARRIGHHGVPILGVNLGGLGFITVIPLKRLYPAIEMMLASQLKTEKRVMLETRVIREGQEVCRTQVLNDIVINKQALARIIDLDVTINNEVLTTFRSDGLIISTPTGSTAYNLSAGGPILYPTLEALTLTPICPFTLTNRPIIVPDTALIQIMTGKDSDESVIITFDGQVGFDLYYGDRVLIRKSEQKVKLLIPPDHNYFNILKSKLMWGAKNYNRHADH